MKVLALFAFLVLAMVSRVDAADPPRPNILYFYVDDMGWGSIGPNGQWERRAKQLPYVRTPNLDQLAKRGINFRRGYGCHVCSPARSSQQSGFHQGHTFADRNDPNNAKKAMRADDVLMGDALAKAGYVTGYWGKWGYGGSKDMQRPVIENVQTLPTSHGYQYVLAELHHVRAHTFFQPTLWSAPAAADAVGGLELIPNSLTRYQGNASYPTSPALQNHARYPKTAYCDDAYAFAALDFVRDQGTNYNETGQPFFGLLAVQIPHAPFREITQLPNWDEAYADDPAFDSLSDQTRQWAAMVTRIDAHFGNILAALEDPNQDGDSSDSIVDKTLVVFQSDNGGPGGRSLVELDANGGLSGNKGKIQEGGIRVPLVMTWPGQITPDSTLQAGTNCEMVVDVTDLLPTFCELAGTDTPVGIDGVSIAPTLLGRGHQRRRDFIIHEAGNGQSIIRGQYKLIRSKSGSVKLYDLDSDRTESRDLADTQPELVKELETLLLGERVTEPKGFANTYHTWIGEHGGRTSDAGNWSNYAYSNAGTTYLSDDGPPRLSWVAKIQSRDDQPTLAVANEDLQVLGLQIGGAETATVQTLRMKSNVCLTGRNEIRLSPNGSLEMDGGVVRSLRWIDIQPGASLIGNGTLDAVVYNKGSVSIVGETPTFRMTRDYHQDSDAELRVTINEPSNVPLKVDGDVWLSGALTVDVRDADAISKMPIRLIRARRIRGKFLNADDELVAKDGSRYQVTYSATDVVLTPL